MGRWIDLQTAHGNVAAWRAEPPGRPRAGLVVIQEIFGVNDHMRSVADQFASEGYLVLAPALFDVLERGVALGYDRQGVNRGRGLIALLGLDRATDIVAASALVLETAGKVGSVGYCWGGTVALLAALRLGLPSVSYYGARNLPYLDQAPKAPVMFHFGEHDASIPPEMVAAHREHLPQMETFTYPAGHGFSCDARADFDPESAALARERTLGFFASHLA